jgi:hypothetical protein
MANILACQTLGEMSTPSRAGAEQYAAKVGYLPTASKNRCISTVTKR